MRPPWVLLIMASGASAAGCTLTIPYMPSYGALKQGGPLSEIKPGLTLVRGSFSDTRPEPDKLLSLTNLPCYTVEVRSEKPMGDTLFEGIRRVLVLSGHELRPSGEAPARVDIVLQSIERDCTPGVFESTSTFRIKVKVQVSGAGPPFAATYLGSAEGILFSGGKLAEHFQEGLDTVLSGLMNKVGQDRDLANALKALAGR